MWSILVSSNAYIVVYQKLISAIAELCYLLRYPWRHGRKSGCPFSIRQMTVCQRFDHVKKTSRWIFVQAPDDLADELRSERALLKGQEQIPAHHIHRQILRVGEQEWHGYLCYLESEFAILVRVLQSLVLEHNFDFGFRKKKPSLSTSMAAANRTTGSPSQTVKNSSGFGGNWSNARRY